MILNKYQYVNKIIPDLSYVDYAEKCYWQKSPTRSADNLWYYVHNYSTVTNDNIEDTIQSYRCVIVSPTQLTFTLSNATDQTVVELSKYNDRFVYVFFDSDDENNRVVFPKSKYSCKKSNMLEYPYIIELRF